MVNYQQLSAAKPSMWFSAADDWTALGKSLTGAADDLAAEGHGPIPGGWSSPAGQAAQRRITLMWWTLQAGGVVTTAVADVLHGLGRAVTLAQETLGEARDLARRDGVRLRDDGSATVDAPPPARPGTPQEPPLGGMPDPRAQQVERLVQEAVREATQADQKAQWALQRLVAATSKVDITVAAHAKKLKDYLDEIKNYPANDASRAELQMIMDSIPKGPSAFVSQWWAGLPPAEQERLKLAAPGVLGTLNGIPANVQAELRGSDGIDRVKMINYALQNWNNTDLDTAGDNCTNFVSDALLAGGLHEKGHEAAWLANRGDENTWYQGSIKNSNSWGYSPTLHSFLTNNHSQQVPSISQARPGDVIFWGRGSTDPSTIHHAAVVTAVVDGHVYYTQHSGMAQNADLNLRQPTQDRQERWPQIVVRPHQD